jgi:hypothetical protein
MLTNSVWRGAGKIGVRDDGKIRLRLRLDVPRSNQNL